MRVLAVDDEALGDKPDLDATADEPSHARISSWLLARVAAGKLRPDDKLPPEEGLAAALGVSRMTLRQALGSLEQQGWIERLRGRSGGNFIREPRIEVDLTGLPGFTEQMRRAHVRAGARVVSAVTRPATRTEAHALGLPRSGTVHEVVRVRSADRVPLALEQACFPAALFPDLLDQRLTGSLYRLLGRRYDHAPHTANEVLEPVISSPEQARLLRIDAGSPLMLIERTAFTASGVAVEHAHDVFRSDRTRITLRTGLSDDARAEVAGTIRVP